MQLKCKINGKEYNIVQGCTFSEEYNETLDSGSIIISHVSKIDDLLPFDDVFIYDGNFNGYGDNVQLPNFYRHLLVDQFSEELINIKDKIYTYRIELFSETKKLEVISLPNISITQPLDISLKKSVWEYLNMYVEMYSPLVKFVKDEANKTWEFRNKYKLDPNLENVFKDVYCPDFTLNNPSLKDVLTQLMLVKDRIPYVKDDVIYGLDITERKGTFNFDNHAISNVIGSRSSDNHADSLKRTYSNALSQDNSARMVEYLGFRNSSEALLTIENMRIETQFPIYKINKIYLCYYKKGKVLSTDGSQTGKTKVFLCKQDITKLVKLNSERNLLSSDWNNFTENPPTNIDLMSTYKLCTVGYDIGSNYITGWGTKYSYPKGWWQVDKTYIENIVTKIDEYTPYGIYDYGYVTKLGGLTEGETFSTSGDFFDKLVNPFSNNSLGMKSFFFIVDYNAFYNGTVIHSKDNARDDVVINDNSSSSLTLLEKDGLFQKEKINRFGNKAIQINALYQNINDIQELGSVYDDDVIIYHREYSITDKAINVVYYGTKDYVLKNYFVSVYAKHRTYNLMSYGESVTRAENRKMYLMLSKDTCYYEKENNQFNFTNFIDDDYIGQLMSFFKESPQAITIDYFEYPSKINAGFIVENRNKVNYLCDINAFVSGYSICFNLKMYDNVSAGVRIKEKEPPFTLNPEKDFTGSIQDWFLLVDNKETGFIETLGFYIAHFDKKDWLPDKVTNDPNYIKEYAYNRLFRLPEIYGFEESEKVNVIGKQYKINKDNKETIDMTFQIEPITNDRNVLLSQWLMKLSDMLSTFNKVKKTYTATDSQSYGINATMKYISVENVASGPNAPTFNVPLMIFEFSQENWGKIDKSSTPNVECFVEFPIDDSATASTLATNIMTYYAVNFIKVKSFSDTEIIFEVKQTVVAKDTIFGAKKTYIDYVDVKFEKTSQIGVNNVPSGKLWFTNASINSQTLSIAMLSGNEITFLKGGTLTTPIIDRYDFKTQNTILPNENFASKIYNQTVYFADTSEQKQKEYQKNMFIVLSNEELKKTLVYDEFSQNNLVVSDLEVPNIISLSSDNGIEYIKVDLANVPQETKSVQYWYLENGSYKFVFGVNINNDDFTKGYVRINVSLLSTRDTRVYDNNHNLIGNVNNYVSINNDKEYGKEQYYSAIIK